MIKMKTSCETSLTVHDVFDFIVKDYIGMQSYLTTNADIVTFPDFERGPLASNNLGYCRALLFAHQSDNWVRCSQERVIGDARSDHVPKARLGSSYA